MPDNGADITADVDNTAAVNTAAVRECEYCNKPFEVTQRTPWNKKYCSSDCRARAHGFENEQAAKEAANRKRRKYTAAVNTA